MVYAELLDVPGGKVLEKGIFLSLSELIEHDKDARTTGKCWSGSLEVNIALNRHRHNCCVHCGAKVGQFHSNCTPPAVNTEPYAN